MNGAGAPENDEALARLARKIGHEAAVQATVQPMLAALRKVPPEARLTAAATLLGAVLMEIDEGQRLPALGRVMTAVRRHVAKRGMCS